MIVKKTLVVVHLYYSDLWPDIDNYLRVLLNNPAFDFVFTLSDGCSHLADDIITRYKADIFKLQQNRGMDIGPFLLVLNDKWKKLDKYSYVLKIHTKKGYGTQGSQWRREMLTSLLNNIPYNLTLLDDPKIGMLCCNKWIDFNKFTNARPIDYLRKQLKIPTGGNFAAGTMFWIKTPILNKYFSPETLVGIYDQLEQGEVHDSGYGTLTHALERVLGYIVEDDDKYIIGV